MGNGIQTTATAEQLTPDVWALFEKFINRRPGLDLCNYVSDARDRDGWKAYRQESHRIQQDGQRARRALEAAMSYPFNAQALVDATGAFSGRLQLEVDDDTGKIAIDYCTGQYYPTEYRPAAATVLERYADLVRPKHTPGGRIPTTITELKAMNHASGGHFFDRSSMRCFRSRVVPIIYSGPSGVYFVTSEADSDDGKRSYTVRLFDPKNGDVNTFGEFRAWTRGAALGIAREAARSNPPLCHVCGGQGKKYQQDCWHCKGTRKEPAAV